MTKHLLSTTAVVLALAMPAWAQTATDQPAAGQAPATQATKLPAGTAGAQEGIILEQAETQIRAEDLMGTNVVGPGGEEIGKVEDLIFDENEKITGVVVGVGGFLGIGKKEVGLNWDQAELQDNPDTGQKTVMVSVTKADIQAAPDFVTKEEREAEAKRAAAQQELLEQQQLLQQQQLQQQAPSATGTAPTGSAATQ